MRGDLGKVCTTCFQSADLFSRWAYRPQSLLARLVVWLLKHDDLRLPRLHGLMRRAFHALLKALRAIQRLPSANSVVICAVFFTNPR